MRFRRAGPIKPGVRGNGDRHDPVRVKRRALASPPVSCLGEGMPAPSLIIAAPEDHRVRVARERRARMRTRLLATVLATYKGDQTRGPAALDEVLACAGVSKATFYKYFPSIEAAVIELGERLADEMAVAIVSNYADVIRPPERLAIGFQLFLTRSALDPRWANFVTHGAYLSPDHALVLEVRQDFERGIETGDYELESVCAAVALTIGAMVEGMRHIAQSPSPRAYAETLTAMTLRAVGVPASQARATAANASARLRAGAAELFPWWKPI